jgi:hypothetical protein
VPTGYQDKESAWANSAALFERMNVAVAIAAGRLPGVTVDLDSVVPVTDGAERLIESVDRGLLSGLLSERTQSVIRREVAGLPPPQARALAVGLGLGGPDFQRQ